MESGPRPRSPRSRIAQLWAIVPASVLVALIVGSWTVAVFITGLWLAVIGLWQVAFGKSWFSTLIRQDWARERWIGLLLLAAGVAIAAGVAVTF